MAGHLVALGELVDLVKVYLAHVIQVGLVAEEDLQSRIFLREPLRLRVIRMLVNEHDFARPTFNVEE
eukprot:CAMPEP_0168624922 /NCGR_PEP_ID=MMETSP0449_2-20121227/9699_1 /TAXON_ID=1082188 /ORGANISM="Strombidium rassoulzadegani, Strain ras09" /LENGTH=66 /DNA_ID=CAMNT_0008666567 /DNA_START=279 /DNA_END=479 /DNA_ORIENTATION=+